MSAIAVTAIGMVTSLGHDAKASCAAARAGIVRSSELKVLGFGNDETFGHEEEEDPAMVAGHATEGIADGFTGVGKALLLGVAALTDLLQARPLAPRDLTRATFGLNLSDYSIEDAAALARAAAEAEAAANQGSGGGGDDEDEDEADIDDEPDDQNDASFGGSGEDEEEQPAKLPSEVWRTRAESLAPRLLTTMGLAIPPGNISVRHGGHAGIAALIEDAIAKLQRGAIDRAIIGGIDSRIEPKFLTAAGGLAMLRTNQNPVGITPGEAAAFFLLERADDASAALATLSGAATVEDPIGYLGDAPPTGKALAHALGRLLERPDMQSGQSFFVSDHNGTERRAIDWGNALVRLRRQYGLEGLTTWYPAASFGDTGAAAGAVAVCMVARALERGYAPGTGAIITLCSESGRRAAIGVHRNGTTRSRSAS